MLAKIKKISDNPLEDLKEAQKSATGLEAHNLRIITQILESKIDKKQDNDPDNTQRQA